MTLIKINDHTINLNSITRITEVSTYHSFRVYYGASFVELVISDSSNEAEKRRDKLIKMLYSENIEVI